MVSLNFIISFFLLVYISKYYSFKMKKLLLLSALLIFTCINESAGNPCIYE